jgi:hypothetical protein
MTTNVWVEQVCKKFTSACCPDKRLQNLDMSATKSNDVRVHKNMRGSDHLHYKCCEIKYIYIFFPMALQPFLGPWPHISVSKSILHRR